MPPNFKTDEERQLYTELVADTEARVTENVKAAIPPGVSAREVDEIVAKRVADLKGVLEQPRPMAEAEFAKEFLLAVAFRDNERLLGLQKRVPGMFYEKQLTTTGATDINFALPVGFKSPFIRKMKERNWLRDWVRVIPVPTMAGNWPVEGATRVAERVAEANAVTVSTQVLTRVQWSCYPLAKFQTLSKELLASADPDFIVMIVELMAHAMADIEFKGFATGAGTTDFVGLTNSSLTHTVTESVGDPVQTMVDLVYALTDGYDASPKCAIVMHRNAKKMLHTAKKANGDFFFNINAPLDEFHGIKILTCSHLTGTGATKVFVGDLNYFAIFDKSDWGISYSEEGHELQSKGLGGFYARKFNDGKILLDEAFAETTITVS